MNVILDLTKEDFSKKPMFGTSVKIGGLISDFINRVENEDWKSTGVLVTHHQKEILSNELPPLQEYKSIFGLEIIVRVGE